MSHRYLIIGTGPAGISAAEAIRCQDPNPNLALIGEEPHVFYSRPGLAYRLTGELPEGRLFLTQGEPFERIKARAVALDPQGHQVTLDNGSRQTYGRLLVATGSLATKAPIAGADLKGVVKLDNLDDTRHIIKLARRGKVAIVVGGGIIALEIVEGLRARGMKTHYLLRGDRYWHNVLCDIESRIVEERLKHEGVQLSYHTELAEILGKRERVIGVRTKDGRQIKCDLVAIAVGLRPRIELAESAGIETERGILTDEFLQTSAADIFAAGDVAQVFDPLSGKSVLDSLWGVAVTEGRIAGRNMAGCHTPYRKSVPFNVTRLAGLTTTIIGAVGHCADKELQNISRGESETWRQLPDVIAVQADCTVNPFRIVLGPQTLLGAVVMGDQTLSHPLHMLIAHSADITPIREQLLAPQAPIADIIMDFWLEWSRCHAQ